MRPAGLPVIYLVASIAVLAVGIPVALVVTIDDVGRSEAWPVTLGIVVYGGIRLSLLWSQGLAKLFDFFFWLFTYIFMGVAATVQLRSGEISTTTPGMDPVLDLPTALVVLAGVGAYELGRLIWWLAHRHVPVAEMAVVGVSTTRSVVLMGLGLVFSVYFLSRVGFGAAITSRASAFQARNAAWPDPSLRAMFYALAVYPMLVAVGAFAELRRRVERSPNRHLVTALMLVGLAALLLIVNPIASARYTFGTVAFALAVFAGATRTVNRTRLTMLGAIGAFLFLFPIADAFRTDEIKVSRGGFFDEYLQNPDYDSFWQIGNALSFWIDGHVEYGRQLLGSLLFWVPRTIWPDKPTDTGIMLAQYRGYSFDNLSAPIWAEFLVNGGVVVMLVGMALLGAGLAAMDRRMQSVYADGGWWALVGAVVPVYMTILLRGSLLQTTDTLTVMIVCLLFVMRQPGRNVPPALPR